MPAYGSDTKFREGVAGLGLADVVGVQASLSLWRPGEAPLPPRPRQAVGRPPKLLPRSAERKPVLVRELVREAGEKAFRTVRWRQGGRERRESRLRSVPVRPAHRDCWRSEPHAEHWLLAEWPRECARARPILAVESARRDSAEEAGRAGQTPLDCGAGLAGAEAGAEAGPFRRPLVAWVSPSSDTLHGGVWVPGGREEPNFGLGPCELAGAQQATAAGHLRAPGRRQAAAAGLIRTRSRACGRRWRGPSSGSFPAALFAGPDVNDPGVLGSCLRVFVCSEAPRGRWAGVTKIRCVAPDACPKEVDSDW